WAAFAGPCPHLPAGRGTPESYACRMSRHQYSPIAGPFEPGHGPSGSNYCDRFPPTTHIPNLDCPVVTSRGKCPSIGRKCDTTYARLMALPGRNMIPALYLPNAKSVTLGESLDLKWPVTAASGNKLFAIWRKRYAAHTCQVPQSRRA